MSIFDNQQQTINNTLIATATEDQLVYSDNPLTTNSFFGNSSADFQYRSYQEELWQKCIEEALRAIEAANKAETQADRAENEADRAEAAANQSEESAGGLNTEFSGLLDTPNSYIGSAGSFVIVNQFENGLDYVNTINYGEY